jgi:translation initiation factor RLI1
VVAAKSRFKFFRQKNQFFNQFLSQNNFRKRDKPINNLKKNQRNQKSIWVHVYFFVNFKGKKKTYNMNSSHQMEPFDTNIIHFCGLNWCQCHVFFFIVEIQQLLSAKNKKTIK